LARIIGHIDLDYFYAQVEEVENPSIKDQPVIVCVFSGRTEDSGVVSTSNYKARESGVKSGMPIVLAKRKLEGKDPVIVRMELSKYESVSERVMDIVRQYVDTFEKAGIDEAFFDVTHRSQGNYDWAGGIAKQIKESILEREHLKCSIGIGRSKVVAKLASDSSKPDGLLVVSPESTESFLSNMDLTRLYGVGPKTAKMLETLGIKTISELSRSDISSLVDTFGRKLAVYLHAAANGLDDDQVRENHSPSQFSRLITLKHDTTDPEGVMTEIAGAFGDLSTKLGSQNVSFKTLTAIAILTDLSTKTRSRTFETPIADLSSVRDALQDLFSQLSETVDKEFRRVGVRISDLTPNQNQKSLAEFFQS
jgi:DNA polymerase IV (archaeal DinB-like DNA polymerase)